MREEILSERAIVADSVGESEVMARVSLYRGSLKMVGPIFKEDQGILLLFVLDSRLA